MCHPSGCYAKLLRILQLSKFTFFNAKIWLQLLRVPYNTPMCGQAGHCSTPALRSTASLSPRHVGRGLTHRHPTRIVAGARCPALVDKAFSCVGGSGAASTDNAENAPLSALNHLHFARHRHHRTSPSSSPSLDCICMREGGAFVASKLAKATFDTNESGLPRNGWVTCLTLCIFR